jgi:peptidyl-prolyl cis-trans isomerase SurA
MREDAFIDIKQGYTDSGASANETKPVYSAYVPPAAKKKAKVERTRFRESTHNFRQKAAQSAPPPEQDTTPAPAKTKKGKKTEVASEKPGKKEKIRYGQAPRETLPAAATSNTATENAGALPTQTADNSQQPQNPLEPAAPTQKTRFSSRAHTEKKSGTRKGQKTDSLAPLPPDAAEVADRQTQSAPLGLNGDSAQSKKNKKKKAATTTAEKTRLANEKKKPEDSAPKPTPHPTPVPPVPGAPAPAPAPQPAPSAQQ